MTPSKPPQDHVHEPGAGPRELRSKGRRLTQQRELIWEALASEPDVHLNFLRKYDGPCLTGPHFCQDADRRPDKYGGSLVQVFRAEDRVWFTTRGMIEGAFVRGGGEDGDGSESFDYLATARQIAQERFPRLLDTPDLLEGRTLLFELLHPEAPKITDYGERADLVLLGAFDHRRVAYLSFAEVKQLGAAHGLTTVDVLSPAGASLAEQIDSLLTSLAGTDQEGSVLTFERGGEVVYRVKVKSPDYLRLMKLMTLCTYERTVEMIDAQPAMTDWSSFAEYLHSLGREQVPEELLGAYRGHFERFAAYRQECERVCDAVLTAFDALETQLGGRGGKDAGAYRKTFAALAVKSPARGLLFAALDGRLDLARVRQHCRDIDEARGMLRALETV